MEPAESETFEGGVKADLLERRISLTAAGFGIRRTNVPEADARGFYRQIGEAESQGFEVELVGSATRGLGIRGGYALTSTEITRDTTGFVGRELPNAPRHKAQVWATHRVSQGPLASLMFGGGVVSVSEQYSTRDNLTTLPAYTRLDGAASYDLVGSRLKIAVSAQNLTNRRYATSGSGSTLVAAPLRRVAVQLTTGF